MKIWECGVGVCGLGIGVRGVRCNVWNYRGVWCRVVEYEVRG